MAEICRCDLFFCPGPVLGCLEWKKKRVHFFLQIKMYDGKYLKKQNKKDTALVEVL